MTVYISGPMTGHKDLNFQMFNAAAWLLRDAGYDVVNPAELNPDPSASWTQCMRRDIVALMDCDSVLMLPGWIDSKGAYLEHFIAKELGMPVHYRIDELLIETRGAVA